VVIVFDYGMGNLRSVANACEAVGTSVRVSNRPQDLRTADHVILPGVGAFGEAMSRLRTGGAVEELAEAILVRKKPFLGICLGMQVLATRGFEHGTHEGLGWLPGEVQRIEPADPALRVPHIGWNSVTIHRSSPLFAAMAKEPSFYFVHSYHLLPDEGQTVVGTCTYGGPLTAVVERDHIFGTQFHPEKSHQAGLSLLRNFVNYTC
jgi:glutamine amidotransferase